MLNRHLLGIAAIATATLALSGCVVAPAQPYYASEPVLVAPPPPQVEVVGVAPAPGYIWIGGYWGWSGHHHHWVPGRWEHQRPGHHWAPHRWHQDGRHWRQHGGRWERD